MKLKNCIVCKSFLSKSIGLMFSRKKNLVMEFKEARIVPLHTFFVFFPITILFLDGKRRIVEVARMKPFSLHTPKANAKYIVELPFNVNTRLGSTVRFK